MAMTPTPDKRILVYQLVRLITFFNIEDYCALLCKTYFHLFIYLLLLIPSPSLAHKMSEWDSWVAFVLGHAANDYYEKAPQDSPAVWHIQIGGHDGKFYCLFYSVSSTHSDHFFHVLFLK